MDCTFNLDSEGWAHYSYGCNSLRRMESGIMSSQFRPASFGVHRTERGDCYQLLISSTMKFIEKFYGLSLDATITCIDHHDGAAKAILDTAGEVLLCWPHISRTAMAKTGKAKLMDKNFEEHASQDINDLHESRSQLQMDALSELMLEDWVKKGESALATWFDVEYCTYPFTRWGANSSEIIGTTPNQNPIESYHRNEKRDFYGQGYGASTHVSIGEFITDIVPKKLLHLGQTLCGPIFSRRKETDVYKRELILKARDIMIEGEDQNG